MFVLVSSLLSWYFKKRIQQVQESIDHPHDVQESTFQSLIEAGRNTEFGRKYGFKDIQNFDQFRERVPVQDYEDIKPWIERTMKGEQRLLWPSEIKWFAKSSGTTSDKSKFIPVSFESLDECQFRGGRDLLTFYCNANPSTKIFEGKGLLIGGSHELNKYSRNSYYGDLSAVMMNNLPFWVNLFRTPAAEIALMADWEIKLEKLANATVGEDVTSISGVPTWTVLLIERLLEMKNAENLLDIWPNMELYMHGGVSFEPYRSSFEKYIPSDAMTYMESYNASEGFFGIQTEREKDMMLMLDYGIYYEFLPMSEFGAANPKTKTLEEIELGVNYALIITTNSGLWRYMIGDTILFTEKYPYRFRITGRTQLYINTFGEELMIHNAEAAIKEACHRTNSRVREFTAGPIYFDENASAGHEWLIEFDQEPRDVNQFRNELDEMLKSVNSDYEAKRSGDIALKPPLVRVCESGTFYNWMKQRGKLGGQNKVPRLANDRKMIDEIMSMKKG